MLAFGPRAATRPPPPAQDPPVVIAPSDSTAPELVFRDLFDPAAWQRLAAVAEHVEFSAGAVLMRRDDQGGRLYVVEEGAFEVVDARSSPETVLSVLGPGQVLGDLSFIDQSPATAEVRARTTASAHQWERDALLTLLDEAPDLALSFYRAVAATVVARSRAVLAAAVAGGFGAGGHTRERTDLVDPDRVAYGLAADLLDTLVNAETTADPPRASGLGEVLTATCRWFAAASDVGRAAEVGARLRALLGEVLSSSATTVAMLARPEGAPASPQLFRHVLAGRPGGRDAAGLLFDGALLGLPTFRGWRWRDAALAEELASVLPAAGARVLSLSLTGAPISEAQLAALAARGGHVTSVLLVPRPETGQTPPGITRTTVVADLASLLRGTGPSVGAAYHALVVDRVSDVLPDEVLRLLLAWARDQLLPSGRLLVGHAVPADDVVLLDHLLRWPSLPRRTPAVVALLPPGGQHATRAPLDDEAAGLVTWSALP